MDVFGEAWEEVTAHLVDWLVVVLAFVGLVVVTCGLGALLAPNLLRVAARADARGDGPDVADLVDLGEVIDLLLLGVLGIGVSIVSNAVPFVGLLASMILFVWVVPLVIDGHYDVIGAVQVSVRGAIAHAWPVATFQLGSLVVLLVAGALCVVPLLVAVPLVLVASWRFYLRWRHDLLALGDAVGIARRGVLTPRP